jgi:hypothetical protein
MVYGILYLGECLGLVHGQDSGWKIVPREVTSQILIQRCIECVRYYTFGSVWGWYLARVVDMWYSLGARDRSNTDRFSPNRNGPVNCRREI